VLHHAFGQEAVHQRRAQIVIRRRRRHQLLQTRLPALHAYHGRRPVQLSFLIKIAFTI
jgi:hypothetical protein